MERCLWLAWLVLVLALGLAQPAKAVNCYRDIVYRGIGKPIHTCPGGMEENGMLCYPICESGYSGVGPVCWRNCDEGYTDIGMACIPDMEWGDNSKCEWYDKCGLALDIGCVSCPAGYISFGCLCSHPGAFYFKDSYTRGVGKPLGCASNEDESYGLCYPQCGSGMAGEGPFCMTACRSRNPCGPICLDPGSNCLPMMRQLTTAMANMGWDLVYCVANIGSCDLPEIVKQFLQVLFMLTLPCCDNTMLANSTLEAAHNATTQAIIAEAKVPGELLKLKEEKAQKLLIEIIEDVLKQSKQFKEDKSGSIAATTVPGNTRQPDHPTPATPVKKNPQPEAAHFMKLVH